MRTFRSDNNAGVCPEASEAMRLASEAGHVAGYGDDEFTAQTIRSLRDLFSDDSSVFFVPTGTIANTLALACLTRPWQRILCHSHSHLNDDESTAPELFTRCRVTAIHVESSKLTPDDIRAASINARGDVHQPQPGALTISNPTEFGEVYTPDELRAVCRTAHDLGYAVHVDGARFANAVASVGCEPDALAGDAGVDALSFGGTKNGLALGEAAVFFPQGDGAIHARATHEFPFLRKSAGALLSKHRFISAPFLATLREGAWLRHAAHANKMARRLGEDLAKQGLEIRFSVDANAVFAVFPPALDAALRARGHEYYLFGDPAWSLARLMCSFDTAPEDVDALLADVESLLPEISTR